MEIVSPYISRPQLLVPTVTLSLQIPLLAILDTRGITSEWLLHCWLSVFRAHYSTVCIGVSAF